MLSLDLIAFQYPRLISTVDDVTLAAEVPRRTHTKRMRCNRYWLGTCAHCAHACVLQETETSPKRRNSVRKRSFRGIRLHNSGGKVAQATTSIGEMVFLVNIAPRPIGTCCLSEADFDAETGSPSSAITSEIARHSGVTVGMDRSGRISGADYPPLGFRTLPRKRKAPLRSPLPTPLVPPGRQDRGSNLPSMPDTPSTRTL